MTRHGYSWWFLLGLCVFAVSGCASYPISKDLREEAGKDITFSVVLQDPTAYEGFIVIWGGEIIKTLNLTDGTEILILDSPLDPQEMPRSAQLSQGRFIASTSQFLDPALYKKGKKITVAGEIIGKETRPLGKTEYTYPVIMAKQIHLWESARYRLYYGPYYGPGFYYGPGPYYGPFYEPFFGDYDNG